VSNLNIKYPDYKFRIHQVNGKDQIFDEFRRTWVALTPEEWVRQNFLQFLVQVMGYPSSMIAIEKELKIGSLSKRFDILVYDEKHKPWMMIECKSEYVPLSEAVLSQILNYAIVVHCPYLLVSNGIDTIAWERKEGMLSELEKLPMWTF